MRLSTIQQERELKHDLFAIESQVYNESEVYIDLSQSSGDFRCLSDHSSVVHEKDQTSPSSSSKAEVKPWQSFAHAHCWYFNHSLAQVLLSWKYHSGAAGLPWLKDSYRMQIDGLQTVSKRSSHSYKKRRPNGTSKDGQVGAGRRLVRSEEDILWEQEMGRSEGGEANSSSLNLLGLTKTWETRWEDDDENDDEEGVEEDNGDDGDIPEAAAGSVYLPTPRKPRPRPSISSESSESASSDSMASLSSGLDSVTLDALMEVASNLSSTGLHDMQEEGSGRSQEEGQLRGPGGDHSSMSHHTPSNAASDDEVNGEKELAEEEEGGGGRIGGGMTLSPLSISTEVDAWSSASSSQQRTLLRSSTSLSAPTTTLALQLSIVSTTSFLPPSTGGISDTIYHRSNVRDFEVEHSIILMNKLK